MVFRRLRKRGRDRARSSEWRRLGKAFQKDGPTTAKLLRWAIASLTLGTTRSPCSAERRDLWPGKDDTGTQSSFRLTGAWPARQLRMSIKILKAIRLCIGSQCSSAWMNSDICPNLGIPLISRAAAFRTDCSCLFTCLSTLPFPHIHFTHFSSYTSSHVQVVFSTSGDNLCKLFHHS